MADVAADLDLAPPAPPTAPLTEAGRDLLFRQAHTAYRFTDRPVTDAQLVAAYELARMAPTSMNSQPLRIAVLRSEQARSQLLPLLAESNREKAASAAVCTVLAADGDFHQHLSTLAPHSPNAAAGFADPARREAFARANAHLQAGYLIVALRALGLDVGPMGGFDADGVDAEFLRGTAWRSFLVLNIGHAAPEGVRPRSPRLAAEEALAFL